MLNRKNKNDMKFKCFIVYNLTNVCIYIYKKTIKKNVYSNLL